MGFVLKKVVPWGRSYEEYVSMFKLTADDLQKRILGCGDGPASFNSKMDKAGRQVVSIDPIYQLHAKEIEDRISETYDEILRQLTESKEGYNWDIMRSPEELGRLRMSAMKEFLADFPLGKQEGRYLSEALPVLPFTENQFDLALCSHLLFLYSEQLDLDFHIDSISELSRVAQEVRIFPLVDLAGQRSKHLPDVQSCLAGQGFQVAIEKVPYEFQRGGNEMMRVRSRHSC